MQILPRYTVPKYNPHIDDKELELLADSTGFLGLVKPLIARGDLLVAGINEPKALQRLGINTAAVYNCREKRPFTMKSVLIMC
ncbi:hypothetical protein RQL66_011440 [Citrobacter freundii]|uniref:hypothetical protein n=1 Tax=Citrobacter freundii TaxID=546 RepID=UPI00313B99F6